MLSENRAGQRVKKTLQPVREPDANVVDLLVEGRWENRDILTFTLFIILLCFDNPSLIWETECLYKHISFLWPRLHKTALFSVK